jgi:hypothetical protein
MYSTVTWCAAVGLHAGLLEIQHGLDQGTTGCTGPGAVGAGNGTDPAIGVDGDVGEGEKHVALLALENGGEMERLYAL